MATRALNDQEERILRDNHMDPGAFGVMWRDDSCIRLLNYDTRDVVTIRQGDKEWEK